MKETKLNQMKRALDDALKIDEKVLADQIKKIGFKCQKCAKCCKARYGDNTVLVFPCEIRKICETTGLTRDDIAVPTLSEDMDSEGNIHTFEWVLKKNGDCNFLTNGLCEIYDCRPFICKTYPFYLYEGRLMVSACDGVGKMICSDDGLNLARLLKERYLTELKEMISVLLTFRGFKPEGNGICVHDSEGEHWVNL